MTREEAESLAARLGAEHPERVTHTWLVREDSPGSWSVVKVERPGPAAPPLSESTLARPVPPYPEDPSPDRFAGRG